MFLQNISNNTIVSLRTIIKGNVNGIFNDSEYIVLSSLKLVSKNCLNSLTPLHVPIEEHDNIMNENNRKESIEF